MSLEALFPWWGPDAAYERVAHADDVDEFALAAAVSDVADLIGSVDIAGMLHILHNLTGDLGIHMSGYKEHISSVQQVANFLSNQEMKRKLVGTCFASGPAAVTKTYVESFSFKLKTARWGAVTACVAQLSKVRAALRFAWNRRLFRNNSVSCEKDGDDPHTIQIDIVDQSLLSHYFL